MLESCRFNRRWSGRYMGGLVPDCRVRPGICHGSLSNASYAVVHFYVCFSFLPVFFVRGHHSLIAVKSFLDVRGCVPPLRLVSNRAHIFFKSLSEVFLAVKCTTLVFVSQIETSVFGPLEKYRLPRTVPNYSEPRARTRLHPYTLTSWYFWHKHILDFFK